MDANQSAMGENGCDRMSGDEEQGDEKLVQSSNGQKRLRDEFELESDDGQCESGNMANNGHDKDQVRISFLHGF
jgi:hypothetical protein